MRLLQRIRKMIAFSLVSAIGFLAGFLTFHKDNSFLLHSATIASADVPTSPDSNNSSDGGSDGGGGGDCP